MAIEYTWKITGLKSKEIDGVKKISEVSWQKIGTTEDGKTGIFNGVMDTSFTPASVDPTYNKIEEITEEKVISWVKEIAVGPFEEHIHHVIAEQLGISSIVEIALPWEAAAAPKKK